MPNHCFRSLFLSVAFCFLTIVGFGQEQQAAGETVKAGKALEKDAAILKGKEKQASGLIGRIGHFFRFRHRADQRVLSLVHSTGVIDSVKVSRAQLEGLLDTLAHSQSRRYDTLHLLIDSLLKCMTRSPDASVTLPHDAVHVGSAEDIVPGAPLSVPDVSARLDPKRVSALALLHQVARHPAGITPQQTQEASGLAYSLALRRRFPVFGFFDFTTRGYDPQKLLYFQTIVFDGLFVRAGNGDLLNIAAFDRAKVVQDAIAANCKVAISLRLDHDAATSAFLNNGTAQKRLIDSLLPLMRSRGVGAVLLSFPAVLPAGKSRFSLFVQTLRDSMLASYGPKEIYVALPASFDARAWEPDVLQQYTDLIFLDFTLNPSERQISAPAPLKGPSRLALSTLVSRLANMGVETRKLVPRFPYWGFRWRLIPELLPAGLVSYKSISQKKNWNVHYDEVSGSAVLDSAGSNGELLYQIWYDDDISLGKKYDFILQAQLAGAAVPFGDDDTWAPLWDELAFKFLSVDTAFVAGMQSPEVNAAPELGFLETWKRRLFIYHYILEHPCMNCFYEEPNEGRKARLLQYAWDLRVDTLMMAANKRLGSTYFQTDYDFLRYDLQRLLSLTAWISLTLIVGCGWCYIHGLRHRTSAWRWRKALEAALIVLVLLCLSASSSNLFVDERFQLFGYGKSNIDVRDTAIVVLSSGDLVRRGADGKDTLFRKGTSPGIGAPSAERLCAPRDETECVDMPFLTLLGIVYLCLALGGLLTRFLVLPLFKRKGLP